MTEMSAVLDVLTDPDHRTGPSVLGLVTIAVLFLVPGFLAPIGLLQLIGALWLVAAVITAVRDVLHVRTD
ncbi:MAG: hypothetical protein ABJH68_02495 [Ilumatobacter sp.]|uniref:hypothetical protein n=1 Tax=Ilumatobacter sp. TaxID=1967498 RepID=UPI003298F417